MKLSGLSAGLSRRTWTLGIIAVLILGLVFFVAAPTSNRIASGSTWGSAPDGYRAWYDYMAAEGVSIERWQRPLDELIAQVAEPTQSTDTTSIPETDSSTSQSIATDEEAQTAATLLVVLPRVLADSQSALIGELGSWFEAGNQAIVLSPQQSVTAAPFSSQLSSDAGAVTIETRRRLSNRQTTDRDAVEIDTRSVQLAARPVASSDGRTSLLQDRYGSVVWHQAKEQGSLVLTTTPFLAANAYADAPGNFAFLADLVQQGGGPIYIDEYLHGYKDSDVVLKEVAGSWIDYLAKTPLLMVVVQSGVLLAIGLLAQNRRFGRTQQIPPVEMNNSAAYIQALAGVLHKANNHDFLVETLTKAEQKTLQRALGLGDAPVSLDTLQTAWQQTTGRSVAELNVLRSAPKRGLQGESALKAWLQQLQTLHTVASQRRERQQTGPE